MIPTRSRVLLIVDDENAIRRALAALFQRRRFQVYTEATAAGALTMLRTIVVDGLLIDFHLPDMRGDMLFSTAVALQPHLAQRTIVMTGDIGDTVPEAWSDSSCPIVLKPFESEELERIVTETIGGPDVFEADEGVDRA